MSYKDSNPTYNVNRKVANFGDFTSNIDAEKEKLKKVKRSFTPNSDKQQFVRNSRTEYNPVTHKLTDYTEGEVEDKIKAIEELEGTNEGIFSDRLKDDEFSQEDKKEVSIFLKSQIKAAFENTVMCARTNSPGESYEYANRMTNMVIKLIEEGK
jgi:hypothetical protein